MATASRGALLLAEKGTQDFTSLYARTRQAGQAQLVRVSRTIARQVMNDAVAILGVDVPASDKLREVESLAASDVRSLLCVPLSVFERVIGCIYLDSTRPGNRFNEDHLQLMAAIAGVTMPPVMPCRISAMKTRTNVGAKAKISDAAAMVQMPIAARPRFHGTQSTSAPPGRCAINPATVPADKARPTRPLSQPKSAK